MATLSIDRNVRIGRGPIELLTPVEMELIGPYWYAMAGTPTFDRVGGTVTLTEDGQRAAKASVPVVVGATLYLVVWPAAGSTGLYDGSVNYYNSAAGYVAGGVATGDVTGVGYGTGTVPNNAATATIILKGKAGDDAVIDRVSFMQLV